MSVYAKYGHINIVADFYRLPDPPCQYEHRRPLVVVGSTVARRALVAEIRHLWGFHPITRLDLALL
jgi:hypothetical protein